MGDDTTTSGSTIADTAATTANTAAKAGNVVQSNAQIAVNQKLNDTTKQNTDSLSVYTNLIQNVATTALKNFFDAKTDLILKLEEERKQLGKNANDVADIKNKYDNLSNAVQKVAFAFNFTSFDKFTVSGGSAINSVKGQWDELTSKIGGTEIFSKALEQFGIFGKAGEAAFGKFLQSAEQGQKIEKAFLNIAGASGKLDEVFKISGNDLSNLNQLTTQFNGNLLGTARATGLTLAQVNEYASVLSDIPGIFTSITSNAGGATKGIDDLTAVLRLSAGSAQSVATVHEVLEKATDNLGNSQGEVNDNVEKGQKLFALMSAESGSLGIRFKDTEAYMNQLSETFKSAGDNSDAGARILARYSQALKDTGLTGKQAVSIIGEITKSVGGMSTATKAFVSSQSGGPGGLQGAIKIENMIREGKVDEVAKMAENALRKQFGGQIITAKQAEGSQQAAATFTRQRALLQSGIFGIGKGLDEDQATKLLEALASGNGGKEIASGQQALATTIQKGAAVQSRDITPFQQLGNFEDSQLSTAAIKSRDQQISLSGISAQTTIDSLTDAGQKNYENKSAQIGKAPASVQNQNSLILREGFGDFASGVKNFNNGIGQILGGLKDFIADLQGKKLQVDQEEKTKEALRLNPLSTNNGNLTDAAKASVASATTTGAPLVGGTATARSIRASQQVRAEAAQRGGTATDGSIPIKLDLNINIDAPDDYPTQVSSNTDASPSIFGIKTTVNGK